MTKHKKPELTDEQVDRIGESLIEHELDIDSLLAEGDPSDKADEALSDEDARRFAFGELSGLDYQRVEALLEDSPESAAEMRWLQRESAAWKGPSGAKRVHAIARSVVRQALPLATILSRLRVAAQEGFGNLAGTIAGNFVLGPVAADEWLGAGEAADGLIRWEMLRGKEDSLVVRLRSRVTKLGGTRIRLDTGQWNRECLLELVEPGVVGADVEILAAERRAQGAAAPTAVIVSVLEPAVGSATPRG